MNKLSKRIISLLVLSFAVFNEYTFSQSQNIPSRQDEFYKMIEDMRARHREMMKSLLNDDADFGSIFEQMEKALNDNGFGDMMGNQFNPVVGEYDWLEDEQSRTLKIKVTQIKDKPLDIKIEKRMITLKGNVESVQEGGNKKSVVLFERSFSIPDDVDASNPKFENKSGEFHIRFPKLKNAVLKKGLKPKASEKNVVEDERLPLDPSSGDLSL